MSTPIPPAANEPAPPALVMPGRSLPAGAGMSWISEGWSLFTKAPLMWIVLVVLVIIVAIALGVVPFIGNVAFQIISPAIAAGFMFGCWSLENGGELEIEHALAGFKRNFSALAMVGLFYLLGCIAIFGVFAMFVGFSILPALIAGGGDMANALAAIATMGMGLVLGVLVAMALGVLLVAAYWFAPALVAMHGLGAVDAMKASFFASFRNFLPFLVYGLVMSVLLIVAAIPFGLGLLVWFPLAIASTYRAYRQIFTD